MRLGLSISFILLLIIASCSINEEERAYIHEIDKLEKAFDSVSDQYMAIDTTKLINSYDLINSNLLRLSKLDTILSDSAKIYAFIQKTFKRFIAEHKLILTEISFTKNQLKTLKRDIRGGKIHENDIAKYYQEEYEATSNLMHKMGFNTQSINYQLQSFEQLNEKIELMINRFENK